MVTFLSVLFTLAGLASAVFVVINKTPMNGALFLIVTLFTVAANYVLLTAEFLAAVQIIVYAGAIMVLIVFVIQLIGFHAFTHSIFQKQTPPALVVVSLVFVQIAFFTIRSVNVIASEAHDAVVPAKAGIQILDPRLRGGDMVASDVAAFSQILFTKYLLPFEIASVLLLVAIIGTVLLAQHKDIRE